MRSIPWVSQSQDELRWDRAVFIQAELHAIELYKELLQSGAQVGILLEKLALLRAELLDLFEIEFDLGRLAEELFSTKQCQSR
jgi:hypothetical protein